MLGGVYFDPKDTKHVRPLDPYPGVRAELCLKCGALDLSLTPGDVKKVVKWLA